MTVPAGNLMARDWMRYWLRRGRSVRWVVRDANGGLRGFNDWEEVEFEKHLAAYGHTGTLDLLAVDPGGPGNEGRGGGSTLVAENASASSATPAEAI